MKGSQEWLVWVAGRTGDGEETGIEIYANIVVVP